MSQITVLPVRTHRHRQAFLTFPWKIYKHDPLWVPPLLSARRKTIDPAHGMIFKDGYAGLFVAWRKNRPVGTIACAEDFVRTRAHGVGDCMLGFFECIDNFEVAEALFCQAEAWAREHNLVNLYGTYNLDREDSRGILIEGRDRPPVSFCGHNPAYYQAFFERYGFNKLGGDGLAFILKLDLNAPEIQRLMRLADRIRLRRNITVRTGNFNDIDGEIERIVDLQNRGMAHFEGHTPFTRASIEAMILPVLDILDPDLILFAEVEGKAVGWLPGIPDMNEVLIHLNGLRHPWDYLRLLRYARVKPKTLAIKSVSVLPEYWDTGVGVLLFDEMARRASNKGYQWVDLSVTGEYNTDTNPLVKHLGGKIYKRYRFFTKPVKNFPGT